MAAPDPSPWAVFRPDAFPFTIEAIRDLGTPDETVVWSIEVPDAGVVDVPVPRDGVTVAVRFRFATGEVWTYSGDPRAPQFVRSWAP